MHSTAQASGRASSPSLAARLRRREAEHRAAGALPPRQTGCSASPCGSWPVCARQAAGPDWSARSMRRCRSARYVFRSQASGGLAGARESSGGHPGNKYVKSTDELSSRESAGTIRGLASKSASPRATSRPPLHQLGDFHRVQRRAAQQLVARTPRMPARCPTHNPAASLPTSQSSLPRAMQRHRDTAGSRDYRPLAVPGAAARAACAAFQCSPGGSNSALTATECAR